MIDTRARLELGSLAHLAGFADRIDADLSRNDVDQPSHRIVSTEALAVDATALPDIVGEVPVLTAGPEPLSWAISSTAVILGADVPELVPDILDDEGRLDHGHWSALCAQARDQAADLSEWASMPERLIDEIRDRNFQAALGYLRRTSSSGQTVLVDGPVPAAAALILGAAAPGQADHVIPLQVGSCALETRAWSRMGIEPVLPWSTRVTDGSLAPLALTAIFTARELLRGLSQRSPGADPAEDRSQQMASGRPSLDNPAP